MFSVALISCLLMFESFLANQLNSVYRNYIFKLHIQPDFLFLILLSQNFHFFHTNLNIGADSADFTCFVVYSVFEQAVSLLFGTAARDHLQFSCY